MKDDKLISNLNQKSSSEKGSLEIAQKFTEKLESEEALKNPWVVWHNDPKKLGEQIYKSRNRKLSGLVIGVKDVISTSDFPTKMGAECAWSNSKMGFDARIIAISKELGAVVGGKTKTSEFAVHKETDVINPKYPEFTAGTSSAGSAAAVANGTVDIALATQTAGSIARPSSYCGVLGFKPTFGDFPRTGVLKTTDDFDTLGILGRNLSLMRDFYLSTRLSGPDYPLLEARRRGRKFNKVTILTGNAFDSSQVEIQDLVRDFYKNRIKKFGFQLMPNTEFLDFNAIRDTHKTIYRRDLSYYFESEIKKGTISQELLDFIDLDNLPSLSKYQEAKSALSTWQKNIQAKFESTLILSLAASTSAPVKDHAYGYDLNAALTAAGFPSYASQSLMILRT